MKDSGHSHEKTHTHIKDSGHSHADHMKTQSVAKSPKNSVGRKLAVTLYLSANERPQNASFRKLGLLEGSKSNLR